MKGVIEFYSVERGYGILSDGVNRIFFRAEDFPLGKIGDPPPLTGEEVKVSMRPDGRVGTIERMVTPIKKYGVVESYDSKKRWGFIREVNSDGRRLFLHGSEIVETWTPVKGTTVEFYEGSRMGKPRACQVSKH